MTQGISNIDRRSGRQTIFRDGGRRRQLSALMNQLRYRAVEQKTLSSP
jgi:hypothetical protein